MIYGGTISTPANTAASAPLRTEVEVTSGLVYHLKVIFPPGPSGLLHVRILDGTYQVFPTTHGASFHGDNIMMEFDELYPKDTAPLLFVVETWNLDDTYAHEVDVLLSLASKEEFQARYLPMSANNALVQALGEQEAAASIVRRDRAKKFLASFPQEEGE